ncbi:hypothetical protein GCM10007938_30400 [Vibrio zhanjiangensis]|uniref:Uncharacterized protein n=1 Tax=Vibrio zhanjiangensis TaxID=1046128 RepID=A0ABQ6F184_9VIBR|nr:hypothetical protein GCM10007938_30400 [Vibrio zhanjiangensis]
MNDQIVNDESLELIDAMEIGFILSDYERITDELVEELVS